VQHLLKEQKTRDPVVSLADGQVRPRWRGRLHFAGFLISLPAGLALLWLAETVTATIALLIYAMSLMALFGTSAGYHLLARTERAQIIMRRLDHSMIFVQIAGTYTPVCVLALPGRWGYPILVVIWSAAALGVAVKLMGGARLLRISNALYIIMGWVAIAALPAILSHLSTGEFLLLLVGGAVYTIGAVLFFCRRPTLSPSIFGYHEVWHSFTVVAALAHFSMVWLVAG
jgi:hemolysin III